MISLKKLKFFTWLGFIYFFMIIRKIKSQDYELKENQQVLEYLFESNPTEQVKSALLSFTDKQWHGISIECKNQFSYFTSALKKREPWALTGLYMDICLYLKGFISHILAILVIISIYD